MLILISGATHLVRDADVGHLIVPRKWNRPDKLGLIPGRWAMDNGCFGGFDPGAFVRMLDAHDGFPGCLFVTVPDVVADAASTRQLWPFWSRVVRGVGHRPAFVAQDGADVRTICGYAKARGKWIHWGRVNGRRRYRLATEAGADSIDGSGFSIAPDMNVDEARGWEQHVRAQPRLGFHE